MNSLYCNCRNVSYGKMIACENPDCEIEWYHYECVGINEDDHDDTKPWFCQSCTVKLSLINNKSNKVLNIFRKQIKQISKDLDESFPDDNMNDTLSKAKKDMLKTIFVTNDRKPKNLSISSISNDILELQNDNQLRNNENIDIEHLFLSSFSRKRNNIAMLLAQSEQAFKRRSIVNTNPRGIEHNIKHINEKSDSLLRYKSNNNKYEDSIIKSTIIEGFHNLNNDNNGNKNDTYYDSSDVTPSKNLVEHIKIMIISKLKKKYKALNNFNITDSAYEAITIVVEELVKELFLSWRNRGNKIPVQTNAQLTSFVMSQLQGCDKTASDQDISQTILNRVLVLTGNNDKEEIQNEILKKLNE